MDQEEVLRDLRETLEDRRLSRGERKALREGFDGLEASREQRDWIRAKAYDMVESLLAREEEREALRWLRDTTGLLRNDGGEDRADSEAAFSPGEDCRRMIGQAIDATRRRVDVCVFTITDDRLTAAIAAAHKRGVAVRIVTDDQKAEDRGSDVDDLTRIGVPVAFDDSEDHMHHKFALFDRGSLRTGSYNWTRSAFRRNQENTILAEDASLVRRFESEFERLWKRFAS